MGSIKEKIKYIKETKKLIREAIIAQGVDVPENTTFRDYANKIKKKINSFVKYYFKKYQEIGQELDTVDKKSNYIK